MEGNNSIYIKKSFNLLKLFDISKSTYTNTKLSMHIPSLQFLDYAVRCELGLTWYNVEQYRSITLRISKLKEKFISKEKEMNYHLYCTQHRYDY